MRLVLGTEVLNEDAYKPSKYIKMIKRNPKERVNQCCFTRFTEGKRVLGTRRTTGPCYQLWFKAVPG